MHVVHKSLIVDIPIAINLEREAFLKEIDIPEKWTWAHYSSSMLSIVGINSEKYKTFCLFIFILLLWAQFTSKFAIRDT